ncbi:unnamed protein product, partial [Phaeothamnion confervicola]
MQQGTENIAALWKADGDPRTRLPLRNAAHPPKNLSVAGSQCEEHADVGDARRTALVKGLLAALEVHRANAGRARSPGLQNVNLHRETGTKEKENAKCHNMNSGTRFVEVPMTGRSPPVSCEQAGEKWPSSYPFNHGTHSAAQPFTRQRPPVPHAAAPLPSHVRGIEAAPHSFQPRTHHAAASSADTELPGMFERLRLGPAEAAGGISGMISSHTALPPPEASAAVVATRVANGGGRDAETVGCSSGGAGPIADANKASLMKGLLAMLDARLADAGLARSGAGGNAWSDKETSDREASGVRQENGANNPAGSGGGNLGRRAVPTAGHRPPAFREQDMERTSPGYPKGHGAGRAAELLTGRAGR